MVWPQNLSNFFCLMIKTQISPKWPPRADELISWSQKYPGRKREDKTLLCMCVQNIRYPGTKKKKLHVYILLHYFYCTTRAYLYTAWVTSKVTRMNHMFQQAYKLINLIQVLGLGIQVRSSIQCRYFQMDNFKSQTLRPVANILSSQSIQHWPVTLGCFQSFRQPNI